MALGGWRGRMCWVGVSLCLLACSKTAEPPGAGADGGVVEDGGSVVGTLDGGAADGGARDGGTADAGGPMDAGVRPLLPDGGCPAPARITPADLGSGYLPPSRVTLYRAVDGDTAHVNFPDGGAQRQPVRFLYVNTEESFGAETTVFGVRTSAQMEEYLRAATELVVVPREDRQRPGFPNVDAFDRWLALVFVNGELLQTRIVREGLSPYYTQFGCAREPVHTALLYAEAEARRGALGVWRVGHPTDYQEVLERWLDGSSCRPNPYLSAVCR